MDNVFAERYAFCDFSNTSGFPNLVPDRSEWEGPLPRFRGEDWKVPTEFLLNFHECMLKLKVIHEDVMIKLFRYSFEGKSHDQCRSLSPSSISSLQEFHTVFHHHCKIFYPIDLLFEKCSKEFEFYIQHSISNSSGYKDEAEKTIEHVKEESSPCKNFSSSLVLK